MNCTCIFVDPYGLVHRCSGHQTPEGGKPSPLGISVRRKSHTHKTGSPSARANRRNNQLARENLKADHKKKKS